MHEAPTVHLEDLPPALHRERERQNASLEAAYSDLAASPAPPSTPPSCRCASPLKGASLR
jgi:hypothetical protein